MSALAIGVGVLASADASAGTGITTEAINVYDYGCSNLTNCVANADNFRTRMFSGPDFTQGLRYADSTVYETDFEDPSAYQSGIGADYANFDRTGQPDAISFFSGHGVCDDQSYNYQYCTSSTGCQQFPSTPGSCLRYTENPLEGRCSYKLPRKMLTNTSGGSACQTVYYSAGRVLLGESPNQTWGNAGTDGGVNFAVFDVSCGVTPGFELYSLQAMFRGVSTIASLMPTRNGDDSFDTADRGKAWADRYIANSSSSISLMWIDALNGTTGGRSCQFGGGNHGFAGCGATLSMSMDSTPSGGTWANTSETWTQIRQDANDALGAQYYYYHITCNYDCNNHPILL